MDIYGAQRLARTEHERMVRSLPTVSEYGDHLVERKSEQKLKHPILRLLIIFVTLLHSVGK